MKIHHFIIEGADLNSGAIENSEMVSQITRVLKLKRGEMLWLGDGDNNAVIARITDFDRDSISYEITEEIKNVETLSSRLVLACSVLKKENFELVVQKATELGIHEIVPFISARTVKTGLRYDRLKTIVREASEQSGRGILPEIKEMVDLEKLPEMYADFKNKYICHISDEANADFKKDIGNTIVVVGPEGGFEDREVEFMTEAGFKILSLSDFTLRAETAVIVALALLKNPA